MSPKEKFWVFLSFLVLKIEIKEGIFTLIKEEISFMKVVNNINTDPVSVILYLNVEEHIN